ncbi:formate dehydrogenase accessory protein FdhE [Pseudodesulfovibrio sp. zrk46]|uniref:formate dehydrogenase accessory protein FdhE n=1 Tax=Pseudodesulfovibrio sp. zrk46 TaxID=2725288 RepID=UPI0014492505|nr:formate dehydrogenase accessory protein FdhE [Pseudodesulfovibrio sp. zrk46]QJB57197.1 formate dehydrogenase accessory protein FdhE [Pseudodesulfovibrio sp. zrk46]
MKGNSERTTVETTLDAIRARIPAYAELADRFGSLFSEQERLHQVLADKMADLPAIDHGRIAAGVPILVDQDFSPWTDAMKQSVSVLLPLCAEVLQLDEDTQDKLRSYLDDPEHLSELAQARIEGNWKHFENTSVQLGIDQSTTLLYISETVFAPVLSAMVRSLGESLPSLAWEHGYCPVCGSTPSISQLSPKEVTDLDQLVGGGGKKFLHCSLCGHDWRYKRNACVACGNDENESREVFFVDERKAERVEACHKCGKYMLNIDMREYDPKPNLDAVQIGLIHLDIFAQNKELTPISSTLWNNLE